MLDKKNKRGRWIKRVLATVFVLAGLGLAAKWYHHFQFQYEFPYGRSHNCDKMISFALLQYADAHDGWFPQGEETPEASLSLLYKQDPSLTCALPGKTVPESVVTARLASGNLLTPETCGWHYVPGLRSDDNPRLGLFWDKVGLGHNGERLRDGGHVVWFVSGAKEYIPANRWEKFLGEQEELHSQLTRPAPVENADIPNEPAKSDGELKSPD